MRLALKAQSQSRATNETLADIKNPPNVAFVKAGQANIAQGPLQVNSGVQPSGARENEIPPSKLLGDGDGQRLDTGAVLAPGRANQALATVEQSTGPITAAGKALVSRNGYKGGTRQRVRKLAKILRGLRASG